MAFYKHGHSPGKTSSRTYQAWRSMKKRCYQPKNAAFAYHGARGIAVCERWRDNFRNFLEDMGECPEGHSLDRYPDNDGNYEPGNCRWATPKEQGRNKRNNTMLVAFGRSQPLSAWAEEFGIGPTNISGRIKRGWPVDKAISTPARFYPR